MNKWIRKNGLVLSCGLVLSTAAKSESLTIALATEAAEAAMEACEKQGYHVTASVVNADGIVIATLRDTHATPHTLDSAKAKAYTIATFAPIVGLTKTSEVAARVLATPETSQLANVPGVLILSGGVVIKSGNTVIGGIGVGGAPGGKFDEACAEVGAQKIKDRL